MPFDEQRRALFRRVPALAALGDAALQALAGGSSEASFTRGQIVVREGEPGDCAFVVVEGSAEVSAAGPDAPIILAALSAGELFGELALLSESARRAATVTAASPLRLIRISGPDFRRVVADEPQARARFDAAARLMLTTRFLKLAASPFAALSREQFRKLAARLRPVSVPPGTVVVRQGDVGDECFVVRNGHVEVVLETAEGERPVATLGPGSLFGEAALLTSAPRNATVRSLDECDLLALQRSDLVEIMSANARAGADLRALLQMRARPRQAPKIEAVRNTSLSGDTLTILKDASRHVYYRLSPQGAFIWSLLDGHRNLKDLTLAYMGEYKAFAPQAILHILSGLTDAGFVKGAGLAPEIAAIVERPGAWQKALATSRAVLEVQLTLRDVDKPLGHLYKGGARLLFTRPAQCAFAIISVAGVLAFVATGARASDSLRETSPWLLLCLFPVQMVSLVAHEAGHAFATKAIGREVQGIGVGWYWFSFVAFVDTTDTWLASRWQRVAVSIAGPYTNLVLGSMAALAACFVEAPVARAVLAQCTLVSYVFFVINLDPLLEYDGYYILTDILDRPNLRQQVIAWLGSGLLPALKQGRIPRERVFDVLLGAGSITYVIAMAAMMLIVYRVFAQDGLARWIPAWAASGLAWVFTAAVVLSSAVSVLGDLKSTRAA